MSHILAFGDSVTVDTSADEGGIIYPLNDLYPLNPCIVDTGSDGLPIAYCPYRVYEGDICFIKDTEEGPALIPEEMSGRGTFDNSKTDTAHLWATESCSSKGATIKCGSCPTTTYNSCNRTCKKSYTHNIDWSPGFSGTGPYGCNNYNFLGWTVTGSDSTVESGDKNLTIDAKNAYEYVKITMSAAILLANENPGKYDTFIKLSDISAVVKNALKYSRSGTTITVEAYPGYGGTLGESNMKGSVAVIHGFIAVGGGRGVSRTEYALKYLAKTAEVTLTFTTTGRYGNYQ